MALIPSVSVTIEDRSFMAAPAPNTGRVGFVVILGDRGPHNQVVEVNSQEEFYTTFGKPNFDRTGIGHYMADNFLKWSNRLLVVRPSLMDDSIETNNSAVSNFYIKYNADYGSFDRFVTVDSDHTPKLFTYVNNITVLNAKAIVSELFYESVDIGDYLYISKTNSGISVGSYSSDGSEPYYRKVINKSKTTDGNFEIQLDNFLPSILFDTFDSDGDPVNEIVTNNIMRYFPGSNVLTYKDPITTFSTQATFSFIQNSNEVTASNIGSYSSVNIGDWIYPNPITKAYDSRFSRQIINKYEKVISSGVTSYILVLDSKFEGESISDTLTSRYIMFEVDSIPNLRNANGENIEDVIEITDADNLWTFYAKGAGTWANSLYLIGIRNTELEKLFIDGNGNPIYKYAFMDLYIYRRNIDGTSTLLEGPWSVSLLKNTADGQIIRDIYSGTELYIESVINANSNFIQCKSAIGAEVLLTAIDAELLRLNILSMLSNEKVYRTEVIGPVSLSGISFDRGEDGCLYDSQGRINITNPKIESLIMRVFNTQIISSDGSIENLTNVKYPTYQIDYVISGGYSLNIQAAALNLVMRRDDCLLLADTGSKTIKASEDVAIRRSSNGLAGWNNWNAMIYVQYQRIFDSFTSKYIWFSPIYNAIERHLYVDQQYWIAEPVANIKKGAISTPMTLAYKPNIPDLEDLTDCELNAVITEPNGTYLLTQFTSYKRLSIMKRAHAVKFVHFVKKQIPPLLKDILQRKMTGQWADIAQRRVNTFLSRYSDNGNGVESLVALSSYSVSASTDEARSEMNIMITLKLIRAIESINVSIIVE